MTKVERGALVSTGTVKTSPALPFDFLAWQPEFFVTGILRDCHANVPLCADAGLRVLRPAKAGRYAGSTAGVF